MGIEPDSRNEWLVDYDGYIRRLARVYYTPGYEYDDHIQDIYLAALVTPYRGEFNQNIALAYLKRIAQTLRIRFYRQLHADKRRYIFSGEVYDDAVEAVASKGGQFEHVLLKETLAELRAPAAFKGEGSQHRERSAMLMVQKATGVLEKFGSRQSPRDGYNVFTLRRKLAEHYSLSSLR